MRESCNNLACIVCGKEYKACVSLLCKMEYSEDNLRKLIDCILCSDICKEKAKCNPGAVYGLHLFEDCIFFGKYHDLGDICMIVVTISNHNRDWPVLDFCFGNDSNKYIVIV